MSLKYPTFLLLFHMKSHESLYIVTIARNREKRRLPDLKLGGKPVYRLLFLFSLPVHVGVSLGIGHT